MFILYFLCCSWRPFLVVLLSVDIRKQILLSALMLPLMYFKIVIILFFSKQPPAIFPYRLFLFLLITPITFLRIFSSDPASQNAVLTLDTVSLSRSYQCCAEWKDYFIYPTSYILVRCLSTGAHTRFVPEHLHFLRAAWNWTVFFMKINANVFLGSSFHLFPTQDTLISSEVIQSWKPKQW